VHGDPQSWSAPEFLHYANHGNDVPTLTGELPPNLATANTRKYGAVPLSECRDVPDEAYYDGRVAAEAVRVLKEIKSQPFFLAVGFWKPHAPFNPPKKYWDLYDREKLPALNPARPQGAPDIAFHDSREIVGAPPKTVTFTPEQTAENRHGYFAAISYMDAQIGKVLDALASEGLADKTVVVFVADHGYHIGEHGLWGKTSNFEYDAHVPLLISVPGSKQSGQQTDSLVELVDLFPTLVELCGLPKPAKLDGASLVPILNDAKTQVKTAAFSQFPRPAYYDREPTAQPESMGYSVRTPDARYTEWRDWQTGRLLASELYEHPRDEAELTNRAAAPTDAGVAQAAQAALHAEFPPSRAPSQR
jgi:iduronate 2-sulfatase